MARAKNIGDPRASSSRPPWQATHRPPVEHSGSERDEEETSPSLSPVPSASVDMDEDYQDDDADQQFPPEPHVDLRSIKNEDFMRLRQQNQYEKSRTATDARFHTLFQEDSHNHVFVHKQFAIQKYIN